MIKSVNQIRIELAEIQANHKQLNSFFWGDFLRAYKENRLNYPLMGAFYPTSTLLRNQTQLQLRIYIADKLYKDWSNLNDIESDTLQTCRDIYNTMNNSTRWQTIGRVQSCSVTKFINRGGDEVAGHEMTMNFLIRDRDGVCGLPMGSYDFDQVTGSLCSPVQIYEDGILIDTVPSGGIYNVVGSPATQIIEDSLGNELYSNSIPSGATETQVIQDSTATLRDSLGGFISTTSILAEGSEDITAPDAMYTVEYVNGTLIQSGAIPSDSSELIQVPNPIVCADTTLEVNGTTEGTVVSGSTVDIQLSDSGGVVVPTSVTQVGNNFQVVLPDAPVTTPTSYSSMTNQTGQTSIFEADDDGQTRQGKTLTFYRLSGTGADWFFGHTWRFTGITGGYHNGTNYVDVNGTVTTKALAFPETIVLDWTQLDRLTGNLIGCQYNPLVSGNVTWLNAKTACFAFTTASFASGWRWGNINELEQFYNEGVNPGFAYSPFEDATAGVSLWSSTTPLSDTTRARIIRNDTKVNNGTKLAASARAFPIRTFNISEL